jgi:hypothetical protein
MGHIDIWNFNDEKWVALEDVPLYDTINCQLCNEPTLASDIIIPAIIKEGILTAGTWQCRKCKAVNG